MRIGATSAGNRVCFRGLVALVGMSLALPLIATAQQGQNAVYNASSQVTNSPVFIDASMFTGNPPNNNFCAVLNYILTHGYPAGGAVIDARALNAANTS